MIQAKCIEKFRDKQGKIIGYRLIDLNNQTQDVKADNLKYAIRDNKINVINLKLTSDNRLVDHNEKQLTSKHLGPSPDIDKKSNDKYFKVAEAMYYLDQEILRVGENYRDQVIYICDLAGLVYDSDGTDIEYDKRIIIDAYRQLLKYNNLHVLENNIYNYRDEYDLLCKKLVSKDNYNDKSSKIIEYVETIYKFITELPENNAHMERYSRELLYELKSIDLNLCRIAYVICNNYGRFLDSKFYLKVDTEGSIMTSNDYEKVIGDYVAHAYFNSENMPKNSGFTLAFIKDKGGIKANIYLYKKNEKENTIHNTVIYKSLVVNKQNKLEIHKTIADELNKLAKEIYECDKDKVENKPKPKNKRPYDAESYKEFCDLLLIIMKRYLPHENDFIDELVETDDNGELLHRVSYLEPIYYKKLECRLEFEFYIDEKLKHGYCSWKVLDKNGDISKLPLYGKSHPLYISNMKADFNEILGISEEIKNQLQLFNYKPKE